MKALSFYEIHLWKCCVNIMLMTHELQMHATGSIFILETRNFQILFPINTITIMNKN